MLEVMTIALCTSVLMCALLQISGFIARPLPMTLKQPITRTDLRSKGLEDPSGDIPMLPDEPVPHLVAVAVGLIVLQRVQFEIQL